MNPQDENLSPAIKAILIKKLNYAKERCCDKLKGLRKLSRCMPEPHRMDSAIALHLRELDFIEAELAMLGVNVT